MDQSSAPAAALTRILSLLNDPATKAFILSPVIPPADLHAALQVSHLSPHPTTGEMNVVTRATDAHSLSESMRILFVPLRTVGPLTLGFQVYERLHTNTPMRDRFFLSKTLRDDRGGSLLSIAHHAVGLTTLSFGTHFSACAREHALMVFRSDALRAALALESPRFPDIADALLHSFYTLEKKPCPVCPDVCACPLATVPKRAADDYGADYRNILTFCGSYDGAAQLAAYSAGRQTYSACVASRVVSFVEMRKDTESQRRLAQWGMRNVANGAPLTISRMQLPLLRGLLGASASDGSALLDLFIDGLVAGKRDPSATASDGTVASLSEPVFADVDPVLDVDEEVENTVSSANVPVEDDEHIDMAIAPAAPPSAVYISAVSREPPFKRTPPRIAPAGQLVHNEPKDEKLRKLELKKVRNRAAAHRSNQKKKDALEKMKAEIKEALKREAELRKRESQLREENVLLRKAVTSGG